MFFRIVETAYGFITKRFSSLFVFITIGALALVYLLNFIAGVSGNPKDFAFYFLSFIIGIVCLAGILMGHLKGSRELLSVSFFILVGLTFVVTILGYTDGAGALPIGGIYIPYWIFSFLSGLTLIAFMVLILLCNLFDFNLFKIAHLCFLCSLIFVFITYILGCVLCARMEGAWTNYIVPLLLLVGMCLFPIGLNLLDYDKVDN